jgi:hypothetical protein
MFGLSEMGGPTASTCTGRYPGWQVQPSGLPMHLHSGLRNGCRSIDDTCLPLRGQHTLACLSEQACVSRLTVNMNISKGTRALLL